MGSYSIEENYHRKAGQSSASCRVSNALLWDGRDCLKSQFPSNSLLLSEKADCH